MNFKKMDNINASLDQYKAGQGGVIVYLESTDDEFIFKKWFSFLLSKIEFSAVSGKKGDGGCVQVLKRVNNAGTNLVYGVVDRDVLLGKMHNSSESPATKIKMKAAWWNSDDDSFYDSQPLGSNIFILNRWELENYLLDPRAIKSFCDDKTMGDFFVGDATSVVNKILKEEDDLVMVTSFSTLKNEGNGIRFKNFVGQELRDEILRVSAVPDVDLEVDYEQIKLFSEEEEDPMIRWERLSRMLDGKVITNRIERILTGTENKCGLNQYRGFLADKIINLGLVDAQLKSWLVGLT